MINVYKMKFIKLLHNFNKQKNTGITLVALVITIIVLLILAGVTLSMIMGENGILRKANSASEKTKQQQVSEELKTIIIDAQSSIMIQKGQMPTIKELAEYLRDNRSDIDMTFVYEPEASVEIDSSKITDTATGSEKKIDHAVIIYKKYKFILNKNLSIDEEKTTQEGDIEYTITFDANGGECDVSSKTVIRRK